LYRSGRQGDALAAYRRLRDVLAEDLGVDPSPTAQALELAILNHAEDLDAPSIEPTVAGDRGGPPSGTVTFLFTDIEGSTRRLAEMGSAQYADDWMVHRTIIRDVIAANRGYEFGTEGDAFFVAFVRASDAVTAAAEIQKELASSPVQVRIGVHTG